MVVFAGDKVDNISIVAVVTSASAIDTVFIFTASANVAVIVTAQTRMVLLLFMLLLLSMCYLL